MTQEQKQAHFDKVWDWAVVQKHGPSTGTYTDNITGRSVTGACRYRGDGGNCCFFGVLIPDACYHEKMENLAAGSLIRLAIICEEERKETLRPYVLNLREVLGVTESDLVGDKRPNVEWFNQLQEIHDTASLVVTGITYADQPMEQRLDLYLTRVEQYLRTFAEQHTLTVPG